MPDGSSFHQTTRGIITLTEAVSAKRVLVQETPSLPTFASVRIARHGAPAHVIQWRAIDGDPPDYLIAFQCGYVIRKFSAPADERYDIAPSATGREAVERLVREAGSTERLPPPVTSEVHNIDSAISTFSKQLLDGLIIHLLSIPIGLRIAEWLRTEYPDVIPMQDRQVVREAAIHQQSNAPAVRRVVPKTIFDATLTISAAYAVFWSQLAAIDGLVEGYAPFLAEGRALVELTKSISSDPTADAQLVDGWANRLGLSGWYRWVPFRP